MLTKSCKLGTHVLSRAKSTEYALSAWSQIKSKLTLTLALVANEVLCESAVN